MANIDMTVYTAARSSAANYTDNKTAATSANTYFIPNNGRVGLVAECTAGGTGTIASQKTVAGLAVEDLELTLTAAKILIWGGFPVDVFNNADGEMVVTVSANTNLFAFRLS